MSNENLSLDYKGYTIRWSDNEDVWSCMEIHYDSPKLSAVKRKIDGLVRETRKASAVAAIRLGGRGETTEASIVEIAGRSRHFGLQLWWIGGRGRWGKSDRPVRQKDDLNDFAPDTPEAREAIAKWISSEEEERKAAERARKAKEAIPRLTEDDVAELLKVAAIQEKSDG